MQSTSILHAYNSTNLFRSSKLKQYISIAAVEYEVLIA